MTTKVRKVSCISYKNPVQKLFILKRNSDNILGHHEVSTSKWFLMEIIFCPLIPTGTGKDGFHTGNATVQCSSASDQ